MMLRTEDVSKSFGGLQALESVTVDVPRREIVGLIGPNGAGKTTLFDCITGLTAPDSGDVYVRGERVTGLRPDQRTHRGIGRTFQQVGLVESFTVLENLLVAQHQHVGYGGAAGILGLPWTFGEERAMRARALEVLDYLGLPGLADEALSGLPYGVLKQVEAAAVLATDPEIMMLDEPLAGLAPDEADAFGDHLLRMRRDLDLTLVVIEHHVPFVLDICDWIYVLNFGRVLAEGRPETIRTDHDVAVAYMGEDATTLADAEEVA